MMTGQTGTYIRENTKYVQKRMISCKTSNRRGPHRIQRGRPGGAKTTIYSGHDELRPGRDKALAKRRIGTEEHEYGQTSLTRLATWMRTKQSNTRNDVAAFPQPMEQGGICTMSNQPRDRRRITNNVESGMMNRDLRPKLLDHV
ncbi:hypothetical protein R1flu_011047 [Riccia fluitans]|uniref:Uncharacterized protein n=1 Tax=Riccia fluitans TaxID=41844 RepID=A0ABD1Z7I2_9MARC